MIDNNRIVIALDYTNESDVLAMVDQLEPQSCRLKVGKELFTYCGPQLVQKLIDRGFDVFLDLKYHDIPNTVAGAVKASAELGVWMVNVHASGGFSMMKAAAEALKAFDKPPLLIAVTVLTSTAQSDLDQLDIPGKIEDRVLHYAKLAKEAGLDGVVCSAQEAARLKAELGPEFLLVTPGIRPKGADAGDQHRIVTPAKAITDGSDYLVVGRPITKASQPLQVLREINTEVESSLR
ncbi:orotidine-5'-phosphate decarboxylase [Umboniibacter marinipuniceus]|uniref:Orotidine 5'-phosphate decarboxylase n=1 Tax=Umboniibacter marinipuniceus TaxID=569599 RepID=A0A3M0A9C1_9GAMM|nr:orotidine-5'-phosphate decarboxylase [Umboniibacter marinipuniceus]RMA81206.1 orotidine-5'-phosphate decarboxylase [Umboniibacter marinipuniceus]